MPKLVQPAQWRKYFELRATLPSKTAALRAGISPSTAWRLENVPNYRSSGRAELEKWRALHPQDIPTEHRLNTQAKHCLNDFAAWRLRYMGIKSTPWQIDAASRVLAALERAQTTLDPQYIVINVAPGSGKSRLFGHDIPAWLICRDRSITIFIGSASVDRAKDQTEELLTTLERTEPAEANRKQRLRGAGNAISTLVSDYGRFRPDNARNWAVGAFKVAQTGNGTSVGKEATVAAVGRDSNYLGLRPDIVVWDDLVNEETSGTPEAREKTKRKYEREAEPRVELGGVLILQGQRQFADDLYKDCIEARSGDEGDPEARKYEHVVYKAHYEEHCKGDHSKTAKPYDPADPENSGCLLDPLGVSWHRLTEVKMADEKNGTQNYRIVYQQEDGDPSRALVNRLWIDGGEDKETGERFIGCWDDNRQTGVVPKLDGDAISVCSIDTSPTKYWAIEWWLIHPATERRYLIDLHRSKMKVTDALVYDQDQGRYFGLLEDWYRQSVYEGRPITHLIIEIVSAERYFLDSGELTKWAAERGVQRMGHDTHRNKTDPKFGVQMLGPLYRHGNVRLPGDHYSGSKAKVMPLVNELIRWPEGSTEDTVMAQWFVEHNMPTLLPRRIDLPPQRRPSVVKSLPDGRNLRLLVGAR